MDIFFLMSALLVYVIGVWCLYTRINEAAEMERVEIKMNVGTLNDNLDRIHRDINHKINILKETTYSQMLSVPQLPSKKVNSPKPIKKIEATSKSPQKKLPQKQPKTALRKKG